MALGIHTEETFEQLITTHLVEQGGFERRLGSSDAAYDPSDALAIHYGYDRARAIIPEILIDFVQTTQPKAWAKVAAIHKQDPEKRLVAAACGWMNKFGSLTTLRHGFKFLGQTIRLAYFQPGNTFNPETWQRYAQNRLTVVRQLRYDPSNDNELDLVLFLNGVPIVTAELKNKLTGQGMWDAVKQYQGDRDPNAPIFAFKQRALVHFAVGPDRVRMATKLDGLSTWFLPFNRGDGHGAGNRHVTDKHRTFYLWEEVWQRDSLLDLVGRFIHLQKESGVDPDTGKTWSKETMIFPRYHQLDAVRTLIDKSLTNGPGTNYLVQHSAGSGKSNSIAWLAHRLSSLHDAQNQKVYDSVVVMTDRRVLDRQLQDTIYQFEHKSGVVEKIEEGASKSAQLAAALTGGAPIIICTIHSFGFVQDKIEGLPDRRYALIVDEAHSSQSGEMAMAVKALLADSTVEQALAQEIEEADDMSVADQLALRKAVLRGPQDNMSFFAFTATPKYKTLERFGHKDGDGNPAPVHLYSMRQAIEEGFILDVLRGYTTYERFFKLAKAVADDPDLDKRKAASALARFVNLHPTNIAQKTEIIIEHFRSTVVHQLGGQAKAMLVTGSRLQAVKYKLAFDKYLTAQGYDDVRCLVAFSGEVKDDGLSYTEPGMNAGIKESELPEKFASSAYQVLIVANKYQTGFDQPLLVAMYVDKRLAGVQAVQTLSRLNRMHKGKEVTFVLDFVNKREEIEAAFQPYYEVTGTAETVDPQRLYELQQELNAMQIYTAKEVDNFAEAFFKLKPDQKLTDNAKLNSWLDPAVDRFKALADDGDTGIASQESFRSKLAALRNLYSFLGQIIPFRDAGLEKLYAFARMLLRKLPRPERGGPLELDDDVVLSSLKLKKTGEDDIDLKKGEGGALKGPTGTGSGAGKGPQVKLSTIIELINEKFGTDFDAEDLVDGVVKQLVGDAGLQQAAKVNDKSGFAIPFTEALDDALVERHAKHGEFINKVFQDPGLQAFFRALMLNRVYGHLNTAPPQPGTDAADVLPFRRVPLDEAKPFENCVPALDLKVAAGGWSPDQIVQDGTRHYDWVAWEGRTKSGPDLFVAQVVGESMNRRIPNGAWCVWRLNPGSDGKSGTEIVLAQHRGIHDAETDGRYTVKLYKRELVASEDGASEAVRVILSPASTDPSFEPIVLEGLAEGELEIVANMVEVLGSWKS